MADKLQEAAEAQLTRIDGIVKGAVKASLKWPKRLIVMLSLTSLLLLGSTGFMTYLYVNQQSITRTVQQTTIATQAGAIRGCEQGNLRAQADQANWDFFIDFLAKGDTKPGDIAKVNFIKAHIAATDKTRDCVTEFGK